MRSEEFLLSFQEALAGEVPDIKIQNHVNYYKCYIQKQMQRGIPEEEVLSSLGNPRLLAKTIIESEKFAVGNNQYESEQGHYQQRYENTANRTYDKGEHMKKGSSLQIPSLVVGILGVIAMALLIGLAFCVISYLAPVIFIIIIGVCVYQVVQRIFRGY